MTRKDYQDLVDMLDKAVNIAIDNKQFKVARILHEACNIIVDTYIFPEDLSTL